MTVGDIHNMALARLGAKRVGSSSSVEAIQCNLHYEQARDALLRSYAWRFAMTRAALVATTTPDFEWSYAFTLPSDCLRILGLYEASSEYIIENNLLLTDDSTANAYYIAQVTDPDSFDPLFTDVLVLDLAGRLCMPLTQDKELRQMLYQEKRDVISRARLVDAKEAPQTWAGESWVDARRVNVPNPKQVTP